MRRYFMSDGTPYFDIPGAKSRELLARRQQFVARGVSSTMNVFAAKADGAIIEDVDGNRYKHRFGPFAPEVYRAPFPYAYRMNMTPQEASEYCISELERMFSGDVAPDQVAAIVIEPVQGEGGFMVTPPGFLRALKAVCETYGILFVADEIQSVFCRTGNMFAVEHDGVAPDLMIIAKSIAAGMPLSGVVGRADIMDAPPPGMLGGTYSGNPVACAAALAVLDLYEKEDYAARSREIGKTVMERFLKLQERFPEHIGDVRG